MVSLSCFKKVMAAFAYLFFLTAISTPVLAEPSGNEEKKAPNLYERIDFGNSYILGQSIKSGAVYLLQRKQADIQSMLKERENYRSEILEDFSVENNEKEEPVGIKEK